MAKRGRPSGVTSWWRNPNNIAAHHAQALMELWLAGAPVVEIRVMLSSLAGRPEYQALIDECWSIIENERRFTVPPKIKRKFCRLAVAHVSSSLLAKACAASTEPNSWVTVMSLGLSAA